MISRTRYHTPAHTRAAFTLPELLVVVTITLILMSILVQASTIITSTVSTAKAQGDFVGQERMALAVLRRDLQFDHFFDDDTNLSPTRGRKLSDQRTDKATVSGGQIINYRPNRSGYFWASAKPVDNVSNFDEGLDSDNFRSSRSANHLIQFTIVTPGGSPEQTLTADIPAGSSNTITGTCGEVSYFLVPNLTTPNNTAKFKLIRRQRLVARNNDDDPAYGQMLTQSGAGPTDPPEVVACTWNGATSRFDMFNMNELTFKSNRLASPSTLVLRAGEDVLHNHVTSFELKFTGPQVNNVVWPASIPPTVTQWPRSFANGNTDFPYDSLPFNGEYDTGDEGLLASPTNLANASQTTARIKPIRITGVLIKLRCWNPSTRSTRQSTIAVDL